MIDLDICRRKVRSLRSMTGRQTRVKAILLTFHSHMQWRITATAVAVIVALLVIVLIFITVSIGMLSIPILIRAWNFGVAELASVVIVVASCLLVESLISGILILEMILFLTRISFLFRVRFMFRISFFFRICLFSIIFLTRIGFLFSISSSSIGLLGIRLSGIRLLTSKIITISRLFWIGLPTRNLSRVSVFSIRLLSWIVAVGLLSRIRIVIARLVIPGLGRFLCNDVYACVGSVM
jgi:hypothetical protein